MPIFFDVQRSAYGTTAQISGDKRFAAYAAVGLAMAMATLFYHWAPENVFGFACFGVFFGGCTAGNFKPCALPESP